MTTAVVATTGPAATLTRAMPRHQKSVAARTAIRIFRGHLGNIEVVGAFHTKEAFLQASRVPRAFADATKSPEYRQVAMATPGTCSHRLIRNGRPQGDWVAGTTPVPSRDIMDPDHLPRL